MSLALEDDKHSPNSRIIVLTEGSSDTWIISESIKLLYPHLVDCFTFMDFEGARVGGGAGSLANIVKSFAGAGIVNKVIAIFDNDSAAETATRSLRQVHLPANIRVMKLPKLDALTAYPTIGPSGMTVMDVNGIAASIELYLGDDVLRDDGGKLIPVQWTGYDASLDRYQGEVLFKGGIQERFKRKLEVQAAKPELMEKDWSGIKAILSTVFSSFHNFDADLNFASLNDYYTQ